MDDDCVIIVESVEKQECEQKEVFVISSDSDDSNDDYSSKPEKADTNLENPMYNENDLKKTEPTEELEGDVLLQRLKKKLLAARSLKEQQSLENLIQKRREKILKGTEPPPALSSSNKARLTENNGFYMSDQSPGFRIKNPSKPEIKGGGNSQQGGAFWSLHGRERDMGDLFETGKRLSDKDERELKETLQNMQCALKEKSARRRKRDAGNKTAPGNQGSAVSNLSQFLQQQQQFQADFKQHFDPLACSSSRQQIQRNPRLQPYDKKSMEETQREVGLAEKLGPSNKGFTMLKAMGYKEGEGLGKEGEGRREPVTISKRQGKAGLGS